VEIEVTDFKKVEDVYLDGSFYKRTLKDGEGKSLPNSNARVKVFYRLLVES
jgi:hypothetical protein